MSKVSKEIAEKEVNDWLDYKKINVQKREAQANSIETLIGFISEGTISIKEDKTIVQELLFEIGKESKITKLEYKPRIHVGAIQRHLEGGKSTDMDLRIVATAAALTSQTKELIKQLDSEDYSVASSIAIFFL